MQIRRVLNFEDLASKHAAIVRSLAKLGITKVDHATSAMEGLAMIENAIEEGKPYDFVVTDMYFPMFPREGETQSGYFVIEELQNRGINIPIVVCSSARLVIPDIVGCIHYSPYRNDLDADMREMVEIVYNM